MISSYAFKSLMRGATSVFMTIDPIGILKNYVEDLRINAGNMQKQLRSLQGQMQTLKGAIDENEREQNQALSLAGKASEVGKTNLVTLQTRQAGRLRDSNMTLQALYNKMELLYRVLKKMYDTSLILIEDTESEVSVKEKEYNAMKASYSAFKAAVRIIDGDKDKKQLFEDAMEYLANNYAEKIGEIAEFQDMSARFIDSIDLQNGIYEAEGLKMLEDWEKKSDSLLFSDNDKRLLIEQAKDPDQELKFDNSFSAGKSTDKYGLFKHD